MVADRRLLIVAICVLSQLPAAEILCHLPVEREAELVCCLTQLDRLGIIDLRPGNRYRPAVAVSLAAARAGDGFFRKEVLDDYFAGGFNGESRC